MPDLDRKKFRWPGFSYHNDKDPSSMLMNYSLSGNCYINRYWHIGTVYWGFPIYRFFIWDFPYNQLEWLPVAHPRCQKIEFLTWSSFWLEILFLNYSWIFEYFEDFQKYITKDKAQGERKAAEYQFKATDSLFGTWHQKFQISMSTWSIWSTRQFVCRVRLLRGKIKTKSSMYSAG